MSKKMVEIEVELEDRDIAILIVTGFFVRDPDGGYTVTDKGSAWLEQWINRRQGSTLVVDKGKPLSDLEKFEIMEGQ